MLDAPAHFVRYSQKNKIVFTVRKQTKWHNSPIQGEWVQRVATLWKYIHFLGVFNNPVLTSRKILRFCESLTGLLPEGRPAGQSYSLRSHNADTL